MSQATSLPDLTPFLADPTSTLTTLTTCQPSSSWTLFSLISSMPSCMSKSPTCPSLTFWFSSTCNCPWRTSPLSSSPTSQIGSMIIISSCTKGESTFSLTTHFGISFSPIATTMKLQITQVIWKCDNLLLWSFNNQTSYSTCGNTSMAVLYANRTNSTCTQLFLLSP